MQRNSSTFRLIQWKILFRNVPTSPHLKIKGSMNSVIHNRIHFSEVKIWPFKIFVIMNYYFVIVITNLYVYYNDNGTISQSRYVKCW